jgi:hypothetical protein
MSNLKSWAYTLDSQNAVILFVNLDTQKETWLGHYQEFQAPHTLHAFAYGSFISDIAKAYDVKIIPHLVILDSEGHIMPLPEEGGEHALIEYLKKISVGQQ